VAFERGRTTRVRDEKLGNEQEGASVYVLLTDDSGYHPKPEPETLGAELRALADNAEAQLPFRGHGYRVFGPYSTYDEGKCAAIRLPYEADYWVMEVEGL
jgi:hypothetical protein